MMPILDNKTKPLTSVGDVSATEPPPLQTEKKLEAFLAKAGVTRSDFDESFRGDASIDPEFVVSDTDEDDNDGKKEKDKDDNDVNKEKDKDGASMPTYTSCIKT